MTNDDTPCESLVRLDRKVSRALSNGRGIKFTAEELALLASLGMIEQLSEAKAKALKEQARCQQLRVVSINEGHTGSISYEAQMGSPSATGGTSGGMIPPPDGSRGEARAQQMFG
ncbi:hypothetical protein [Caenibius sp. WL]|uniref:hypothetical protein n=1 Tax=Caenibius sp. WL TaxID=2872646 RepID=UPI001C9914F9|nr:hypothetical protein [Caenibius sp. WL]QZP06850.1 hypothetical protein K5X80_08920 [Caenibius sp. WL]